MRNFHNGSRRAVCNFTVILTRTGAFHCNRHTTGRIAHAAAFPDSNRSQAAALLNLLHGRFG